MNFLSPEMKENLHQSHINEDWNTIIIQYSLITGWRKDQCFFISRRCQGFFRPRLVKKGELDMYIGGHPEKRNFGKVV